jgi:hypothetical protein
MDMARSLALRLHGLHPADRSWLLGQLDESMSARLQALLTEINDLGLAPDINMSGLGEMLATHDGSNGDTLNASLASLASVKAVLEQEPKSMQRCVLGLSDWPWKMDLLAEQNDLTISLRNEQPRLTPRARAAIMQAFVARLGVTPVATSPARTNAVKPGRLESLRNSLRGPRKWLA